MLPLPERTQDKREKHGGREEHHVEVLACQEPPAGPIEGNNAAIAELAKAEATALSLAPGAHLNDANIIRERFGECAIDRAVPGGRVDAQDRRLPAKAAIMRQGDPNAMHIRGIHRRKSRTDNQNFP